MQCIVVKSDEFENSSPLIYFPQILIMLLPAPYGRSAAMTIWYEIYLRLKQRCRKFWTVDNSGIEEVYIGRPYVSFGKTIDL